MLFDTNTEEHRGYMERGILNRSVIFEDDLLPMCPTSGKCLSNKWGVPTATEIPVGVWVTTGQPGVFEVEFVPVCAEYECRLPVTRESKTLIDRLTGYKAPNLTQLLSEVDELLEGI